MKSSKGFGVVAVATVMWLAGSFLLASAKTGVQPSRSCSMDALKQSISIYEAILADVAKTYRQRGGGGISAIVQKTTTTFTVQIAQEGRKDLLTYEVEIGPGGKVKIASKVESTQSY
jgi:hypothetical protein